MQHIFWVIENELAGRPGPNEEAWCPEELYVGGFRAVLTLNSGAGVDAAALRKAGLAHHRIALPVLNRVQSASARRPYRRRMTGYRPNWS